ncbi:TPA: colicin immunity protein Cui [Salmonella enterica subsp. enterica]
MKGVQIVNVPDNKEINKKMLIFLAITGTPLLIIFFACLINPESPLLHSVSAATSSFPALTSARNPLLSSLLNVWCKTAPFWAVIFLFVSFDKFQVKKLQPGGKMNGALITFSLLYISFIYTQLFHTAEMTESGRLVRLMAHNDYLLTFYFLLIYGSIFTLTIYFLLFISAVFNAFRKK